MEVGEKLPSYIEDFIQRVISQNSPEKIEVKAEKRVYLVAFQPSLEDECVNIYGFDISEMKELEERLRESEEKYHNIVETANEGIWIINDEDKTIYVNKKMAEMLGYSQEEMIGRSGWDFTDVEDSVIPQLNIAKRQQGIDESHEFKFIRKDGSPLWALVNTKSFFDKKDKFSGSMGMLTDITERKEAEEKLKETLENLEKLVKERTEELDKAYTSLKESEKGLAEAQKMANIGNWDWDLITGEVYWSDELYRIFGRDPKKLAPSFNEYLNYIHPDDRAYFENTVKKPAIDKPNSIDHRIILDNREERIVNIQAEAVFNERNVPIRVKGIVQDITERKKAEQNLVNLEIARKKEIHHRIKNNLQVISSLLDLQAGKFNNRECIKDSEVIEAFKECHDRVLSIALIHEELHEGKGADALDFSLYLKELAENLLHTYSLGNNNVSLNIDLEENVFFDMDIAVPLGMIVNELVSNSLKYAFPNRETRNVQIKLFSEKSEDKLNDNEGKSTEYTLIVSDNGVGIPEKVDFKNPDTLGLQLANLLVDQLNGTIELKRGKGTKFIIKFSTEKKL